MYILRDGLHEDTVDDVCHLGMELSDLMRKHCEYEDGMWALSTKPEYMTMGETKFSNHFLQPSGELLDWLDLLMRILPWIPGPL
ncbi:hypothetical protein BCR34DRAFT_564231 [Clohesyomyces aquaticus]|uniref:Uncharacterized protein n=1 Tax=Clohesyomyces aquaticus TaxID=1231657 RepID=A0A1Y1ZPD0_9PLEO|nr:hypothetical protein BCR34DRAFT_564231 [Clohesyomyces aquaticus]